MFKRFTKHTLMVIFLGSLIISSCDDSDPKIVTCKIKSYRADYSKTDNDIYTFTYIDGKVTSISDLYTYKDGEGVKSDLLNTSLDYDGNFIVKVTPEGRDYHTTLDYDDKGNLVGIAGYSKNKLYKRIDYEYNSFNQLVEMQYYNVDNITGDIVKSDYSIFSYANTISKNPQTKTSFSSFGTQVSSYTKYDEKRTPFSSSIPNFFGLNLPGVLPFPSPSISDNNVLEVNDLPIAYEYNENGYPTKITRSYSSDIYTIWSFVYECNY